MTQTSGPTRRQVLQGAGAAAGAAAVGSLLPPSLHRAMAAPMRSGGLDAVGHVVLLMQENRSFDHYYGTLRGVRGFGDRDPLPRRGGGSVMEQPGGLSGPVLPFSLREAAAASGRPDADIQYLGALPHGFSDATQAWAGGWWDGWVPAKGRATMTYYDRHDIPLQHELARTFTTLDAYHCSVFGSTNPNRNYFFTGTTGFEPDGIRRAVTNAAYDYGHAGYDWTTYPERLEAAGVSWQIYQEWDNFTDNAVEYFATFKAVGRKLLASVRAGGGGDYRTTEELYDALHDKAPAEQDAVLALVERGRAALTPAERSLFDRAMFRSRPGTLLDRLRADVAAGTLPQVTWLVPSAALSEHPGSSTPLGSANLVHDLLDVLAADLDTWSRTVLMINFDENDGFFDHVPPPVAPRPPAGTGDDWWAGRPIGLGPRVPMTIVSPWTVGGYVDSSLADHTSTLRFLERWTGVTEPNISPWRRSVCSDLTSAFDFGRQRRPPRLAAPDAVPDPVSRWHPEPPEEQAMPEQEAGRAPSRALPYQPAVSAVHDGGVVRLTLANAGRQAAAFTVYPFRGDLARPTQVTVSARDSQTLTALLPTGRWDLLVQGPNRFWAHLAGSITGAAARIDVVPTFVRRRTGLGLTVRNHGDAPVRLLLRPLAHGGREQELTVPAGGEVALGWPTDHGWYDVEVTCPDDGAFRRRLTGRVESGRPSRTP